MRVAGLAVLVCALTAGFLVFSAVAAPPLAAPSISANPADPSTSTAASFTYTDSQTITKFQCQLDSGGFSDCGTTKPSTKAYAGPLGQGSHTFQVRAVNGSTTSSATSYSWSIDSIAPTVSSINRVGSTPTNAASVQWTVSFSEAVKGVDATDFSLVKVGLGGTPAITGVSPSVSTSATSFTVTASTGSGSGTLGLNLVDNDSIVDGAGNKLGGTGAGNGNATGQVFTIDRTAPGAPTISAPAASPAWTTTTTVGATFTGEAGATFQCKLDSSSFGACTSPKNYTGVGQGSHTFQVTQTDAAGNTSPAASRSFQIDSIAPPVPSITSKPANPTNATAANFVFSDSEASAALLCQLDGSGYTACTSPKTYPGPLSASSHTFQVEARDAAGNTSAPATWTWLIDTTPPNTPVIVLGPIPYITPIGWPSTSAVFAYVDSSPDVASYQCKLDAGSFAACPNPKTYSGLSQGSHTFQVKAVDQAGNISPGFDSWTFFVDTVKPNGPTLTAFPPDPSSSAQATFTWTDTDPAPGVGIALYLCSHENGPFLPCDGPGNSGTTTYTVQSTNNGQHQFEVLAVDWAGNISNSTKYKWKVIVGSGVPYTISGNVSTLLYPGGAAAPINLTFNNPNAGNGGSGVNGVQVSNLTVAITSITGPNITVSRPCTSADFAIVQFSGSYPFYIPQGTSSLSTLSPAIPSSQWPSIQLINRTTVNQDGCKQATINLSYTGTP